MIRYYVDTESISFTDCTLLIQYKERYSNIISLHEIFYEPVGKTIDLILNLLEHDLVFYNVTHDSFHLTKTINILFQLDPDKIPDPVEYYQVEKDYLNIMNYIPKPKGVVDLLLHTRKKFQNTMKQHPLQFKIPKICALDFKKILEKEFSVLPKILFANNPCGYQGKPYIKIIEIMEDGRTAVTPEELSKREKGELSFNLDQNWVYLRMNFCPSGKLKDLMKYQFDRDDAEELDIPYKRSKTPFYNPHGGEWLNLFEPHKEMWHTSKKYRSYAEKDILFLEILDKDFDYPSPDEESSLAWAIGSQYCVGYEINLIKAKSMLDHYQSAYNKMFYLCNDKKYLYFNQEKDIFNQEKNDLFSTEQKKCKAVKLQNINSNRNLKNYLHSGLTEMEKMLIPDCSKETFEALDQLTDINPILIEKLHRIKNIKKCIQYIRLLSRLLEAKKLFCTFNIVGTRTNRQSGGDSLNKKGEKINPQGIPKGIIRKIFTFATNLRGGDFSGFEVAIWDARYNDPLLHEQLASGKKIHGIWGEYLYDVPYEELLQGQETKGSEYNRAKNSFFAGIYGAQPPKIAKVTGLPLEKILLAYTKFYSDYKKLGESQKEIREAMTFIRDYKFNPPKKDYAETFLGFKRFFTLELQVTQILIKISNDDFLRFIPNALSLITKKTGKESSKQITILQAIRSALYSESFQIEAHCQRIYGNFLIQSPGGQITKTLQCKLNNLNEKVGVYQNYIKTFNVHDEILVMNDNLNLSSDIVTNFIVEYKKYVPFLKMKWNKINNWSEND